MRRLTAEEVHARKVDELGLDPAVLDLTSVEAIASALRRAASFLCPCAAVTLVRGVVRPLRGLVNNIDEIKALVEETLEALIAHGDLSEHREMTDEESFAKNSSLIYPLPPSFVPRQSGTVILLGVASDSLSVLSDDLEDRVEYVSHVRRLIPLPNEDLRSELLQRGLIELSYNVWLKSPPLETPAQLIARHDRSLEAVQPSRNVPGLSLLDPDGPVRYYRGRWVSPRSQTGRFVGRRSQAYGADLWCYVELRKGQPERLIDFPMGSKWRGCDEAWRMQLAIDAQRGTPQEFRIKPGPQGTFILQLFSPVPMWARKRWDAVGEPVPSSGCLFAYRLNAAEIEEERKFACKTLWLGELQGN
ncbi:MAG: hypothetical protein C4576_30680 [Desulfobacteraceae bacterium]|nr:MAG: hypothetical protein C4576_30680 [Desulfobacteraceae bacterium]